MPLALQSQNMGLQMEPECIRKREAITGGHALSFPKGKWPGVCRDPTYCVSPLLPLAAQASQLSYAAPNLLH